jgi:hypothetical protein
MMIVLKSLSEPVFQIGAGVLVFLAPVLILVLRSSDVPLSPAQKHRTTVLVLLGCCTCLLGWSGGVVLAHRDAPDPGGMNAPLVATPTQEPTSFPTPTPTPTPLPILVPSTITVLTTWCSAVTTNDVATVWSLYSTSLQRTLQANKRRLTSLKGGQLHAVHCTRNDDPGEQLDERKATGVLLLQTADGTGYADGLDRPYEVILGVENHRWKITRINFCTVHGCIDVTQRFVP